MMIDTVLNLLFRCRHRQITRPITPVHKPGTPSGATYVVCLECGRPFPYDLANMRMGTAPVLSMASGAAVHDHA